MGSIIMQLMKEPSWPRANVTLKRRTMCYILSWVSWQSAVNEWRFNMLIKYSHVSAAVRDHAGRDRAGSLRASSVPPQELWHGVRLQGLQTQGDDGERYSHGEVRPRQGVARVSVCVCVLGVGVTDARWWWWTLCPWRSPRSARVGVCVCVRGGCYRRKVMMVNALPMEKSRSGSSKWRDLQGYRSVLKVGGPSYMVTNEIIDKHFEYFKFTTMDTRMLMASLGSRMPNYVVWRWNLVAMDQRSSANGESIYSGTNHANNLGFWK